MASVAKRVREVKQPKGGYIRRKDFSVDTFNDSIVLKENESIHGSLVGLVIDYMTRFLLGLSKEAAFEIPLHGAALINDSFNAYKFLSKITGNNAESIYNACKLVGYDVCARIGVSEYKPVEEILPDHDTIENIFTMINRCVNFWKKYGPVSRMGLFFTSAEMSIITSADCDYLTKDTLWDFKVLKGEIKSRHTLQLLVYYIMGCHSEYKEEFKSIKRIGIFNPRYNKAYLLDVSSIPSETIDLVSRDVIGYGKEEIEYNDSCNSYDTTTEFFSKPTATIRSNSNDDFLDKALFGFSSKKEYIVHAFPSQMNSNDDVFFERIPTFWKGGNIPDSVIKCKFPYIIRFKSRFYIKHGQIPFVMNRISPFWTFEKPLRTSDLFDPTTQEYYARYKNSAGDIIEAKPILLLTSDDFELFKKRYLVLDIEVLDGCYFAP